MKIKKNIEITSNDVLHIIYLTNTFELQETTSWTRSYNNKIIEIFKTREKKRDERFTEITKESEKRYQLMMLQAENERNKYELERER